MKGSIIIIWCILVSLYHGDRLPLRLGRWESSWDICVLPLTSFPPFPVLSEATMGKDWVPRAPRRRWTRRASAKREMEIAETDRAKGRGRGQAREGREERRPRLKMMNCQSREQEQRGPARVKWFSLAHSLARPREVARQRPHFRFLFFTLTLDFNNIISFGGNFRVARTATSSYPSTCLPSLGLCLT